MTEKPKQDNMIYAQKLEEDDDDELQQLSGSKSDTFVVDMERFAHILEKDINTNPRITLQRNLSRKGSVRGGEKKIVSGENDVDLHSTSPRVGASSFLQGMNSTLEKQTAMGSNDHSSTTSHNHHHHQISITNSNTTSLAETKNNIVRRRFSFRHSSSASWIFDPRRILFFFATVSCVGTILLIYFTLSMGKITLK